MLEFWKGEMFYKGTISDFLTFPKQSGVYCIVNKCNGKLYIGTCKDLRKRFSKHRSRMKSKSKQFITHAIIKYGTNNMDVFYINLPCGLREKIELDYIDYVKLNYKTYNIRDRHSFLKNTIFSDESKLKISKSKNKKILALCLKTGNVLHEFESLTLAAKFCKGTTSNISKSAKSNGTKSSKGFLWVYKEEYTGTEKYIKYTVDPKHIRRLALMWSKKLKVTLENKDIIYFDKITDFYAYFNIGHSCLSSIQKSINTHPNLKKVINVEYVKQKDIIGKNNY